VCNKVIDGEQSTILWHVDDLKYSHVDPKVNDKLLAILSERYGKETPLTVTRGKVHEYLGMTLDFSVDGKVSVIMKDYIKDISNETPADMNGEAATPAANHLTEVNQRGFSSLPR